MEELQDVPVKPGDIVAGKYRVEEVLGVGGMGAVVAATHVDLDERRAIKFMLPEMLSNTQAVERFLREARASARLKNDHALKVHDVGKLDSGEPFMVMEYLEGMDLDAVRQYQPRLPVGQAVGYLMQALEAVAEAHAAGIVHRDLKPANLFVATDAEGLPSVKVLDFGISKMTGMGEAGMTQTAATLGSPEYMSPEQTASSKDVDARADIWSIGVILYELVTGQTPFQGESIMALIAAVIETTPPPPSQLNPQVPPAFDAVVQRCLQRERDDRYANVGELATALAPFADRDVSESLRRITHWVPARAAPQPASPSGPPPAPSPGLSPSGAPPALAPGVSPSGPPLAATEVATAPFTPSSPPGPIATPPAAGQTAASWGRTASGSPSAAARRAGPLVGVGVVALLVIAGLVFFVVARSPAAAQGSDPLEGAGAGGGPAGADERTAVDDGTATAEPAGMTDLADDLAADAGSAATSEPSASAAPAVPAPLRPRPKPKPKPKPKPQPTSGDSFGDGRR